MTDSITANVVVSNPRPIFTESRSFKAVANGKIYIGHIDTDPVNAANQIPVYIENEDGSHVQIAQPLIINAAGKIVYNGQLVKVVTIQGHSMAIYDAYGSQVDYIANVLKYDPDQLRQELSGIDGESLVGVATYSQIRSYIGNKSQIKCIGKNHFADGGEGVFFVDENDTTSIDNGGTILIDALGKRWKRKYSGSVNLLWFTDGDGLSDDTQGIKSALSTSKDIFVPKTSAFFTMKEQIILDGHSIISDGIGRYYGNTGAEIVFEGFNDDFAIVSKTKTNYIKGIVFRPKSRSSYSGSGLHIQQTIHMVDSAIVGFAKNNVKGWEDSSKEYQPWSCTFHNCFFQYAGEHNVMLLQGCNAHSYVDCNTSWAGAPDIGVAPTASAEFYGWYISQDPSLAPVPYPMQPEGIWISGGDSSYNAGGALYADKGFGLDVNLTYSELNKTCCLSLAGTLAASHFRIGRATEGLVTALPVVTDPTTPLPGTSIYPARG